MAREDQQRRAVAAGGTGASRPTDPMQEVGLDRAHPPEASIQQPHARLPCGTRRGDGRRVGRGTAGDETRRQS